MLVNKLKNININYLKLSKNIAGRIKCLHWPHAASMFETLVCEHSKYLLPT